MFKGENYAPDNRRGNRIRNTNGTSLWVVDSCDFYLLTFTYLYFLTFL